MSSLLPPNATAAERAMAGTIARVSDVPNPVGDLWNPGTCPAAVLPWLAWALSVDIWDSSWTEAQKRAAIAESVALHRRKGTVWASRTALQRVIPDAALTEWHQYAGEPYYYRIGTENGMVSRATYYQKLLPAIKTAKNVRSRLDRITVRRALSGNINLKILISKSAVSMVIRPRMAMDLSIRPWVAIVPMIHTQTKIGVRA